MDSSIKLRLGISSCLLGQKVRFDGGHKHDKYLTQVLGDYIEWVPVCPETEMGLPTPRENLRLVKENGQIRLRGGKSQTDYTEQMENWSRKRLEELAALNFHGYILKRSSPSCGMERVRVYEPSGIPSKNGVGLYARRLMERFPLLPVEEEGRLNDPVLLENFIERIFAFYRLRNLLQNKPTPGGLVEFHTIHKLTLLAHSPVNYRRLGKLAAAAGQRETAFSALLAEYSELFMHALTLRATRKKHANVLYHVLGYFKKQLDEGDRAECVEAIESYRNGYVPLIVPMTLLKHHLRRHPVEWLEKQTYFNPYPAELMLRNRI
ncbi:MAG: DUF523 and DUF1722 domain-containing protein [Calditrichia bacterium]